MFRQIAPHGVVNKTPMNRKVTLDSALDDDAAHTPVDPKDTTGSSPAQPIADTQTLAERVVPNNDGVKIAQEHN